MCVLMSHTPTSPLLLTSDPRAMFKVAHRDSDLLGVTTTDVRVGWGKTPRAGNTPPVKLAGFSIY